MRYHFPAPFPRFRRYIGYTVDIFSLHGVGGMAGLICTSLFSTTQVCAQYCSNGAFAGRPDARGKMLAVILVVFFYVIVFTYICLWATNKILSLKVSGKSYMDLNIQPGSG